MSGRDTKPRVGLIGLGAMGLGMARNLHAAGLLAGVWNRTAAKAQALATELAVTHAAEPAILARDCELLVTCVSTDKDLFEVVRAAAPGLRAGSVVVDCSTVDRATAVTLAEELAARGCGFVDAPVSGGTEGAATGTLAVMAGGAEADLAKAQPALDAIGAKLVHMGPVGAGQATKAVNQVIAAGINQAVSEGLAFARAMDLPLARVCEVVGGGAAGNWFLNHRGGNMIAGDYPPGFKVALHLKDLRICQSMAKAAGAELDSVELCLRDYPELLEAGHGDSDISSLHEIKRRRFEREP